MSAPVPTNSAQVHFSDSGVVWLPYEYSPYFTATIAFLALQWIAVLLRIYVRAGLLRAFGKDDVACIVALVGTSLCCQPSSH